MMHDPGLFSYITHAGREQSMYSNPQSQFMANDLPISGLLSCGCRRFKWVSAPFRSSASVCRCNDVLSPRSSTWGDHTGRRALIARWVAGCGRTQPLIHEPRGYHSRAGLVYDQDTEPIRPRHTRLAALWPRCREYEDQIWPRNDHADTKTTASGSALGIALVLFGPAGGSSMLNESETKHIQHTRSQALPGLGGRWNGFVDREIRWAGWPGDISRHYMLRPISTKAMCNVKA
ncbi:hypothetical protein F4780DRAFT_552946 [Xylariomycetidae sp. FL0641]|nr:hypothetical protein F4780DRAFT_552946 [Xylariomycetidae sp. FL0641]